VVELLNGHLDPVDPPIAPFPESRIRLKASSDQSKMAYKPLAMKLSEASEILDDRIDEFLSIVQEYHSLEDSAFGSAASQSTTPIVAVGRIASDSMEGRLNAASLVLETSRRTGMGLRIPLNMEKIASWSFFPGQIVALKGSNASGKAFVVEEILEIPLLPSAATTPANLEAHRERLRGGPDAMDSDSDPAPLNILYAAGPYTADDNLDFEPLHALCSQAADTYADAMVLTGPFIDVDHPLIATGDFDLPEEATYDPDSATMTTVFKYLFSPALNRLATSNPNITIILVPSTRDVVDKHVSWPQDMMARKDLGLPKAARLVSNPMAFQMNEVLTAVSSQDALFEIRGEEVVQNPKGAAADAMGRLCRYLIEQRHYFPLFPPMDRKRLPKTGTEEGVATGAVLDVGYLKLGEMVSVRPDVMLTPSLLPPFAKVRVLPFLSPTSICRSAYTAGNIDISQQVYDSVLAINPGPLSKRRGAGTYARMTLYPPSSLAPDDDSGMVSHKVFERARVEIVRI
jgi:DNA polymerase alpha subunit B